MKKQLFLFLIALLPLATLAQFGMQPPEDKEEKVSGSAQIGALSVDGKNYQQAGARIDLPIGKFGLGLDILLLFDEDGKIRTEDWDEWQDYLDKIYYVRYGKKNDPLYLKFGSLNQAVMGYGNVVSGYTNMIEFPTVKRWGSEFHYKGDKLGVELLVNDYKEFAMDNTGVMFASRVSYRPFGKFEIGITLAGDLNEYNALSDRDGDGYPDEIDEFADDKDWATKYDKHVAALADIGVTEFSDIQQYITNYNADLDAKDKVSILTADDLFNVNDESSSLFVVSADVGYPLIDGEKIKLKAYSHFTKIMGYGWGATFPGLRFTFGNWLTLSAEYRRSSDEFMFGYFNSTYDLQRAVFAPKINPATGEPVVNSVTGQTVMDVYTRQDYLKGYESAMNGYMASAEFKFGQILYAKFQYQDLIGDDSEHQRTLRGNAGLQADIIPMVKNLSAYYVQDNVQKISEWKTPSTALGLIFDYEVGGVVMGIDYRMTFQDRDGSGSIDQDNETITTMAFRTRVDF